MPKIDVNTKNVDGYTALHICCSNGRFDLVRSLVETGHADVNVQDNLHNTALHIACKNENEEIVDYLLFKNRADVTVMNIKKETPLSITRSKQNPQIFKSVVFSGKIDLMKHIPCYPYETLLEFLCRTGILERMGCAWRENHRCTCSITAVCEHGSFNMLKLGFLKQTAFREMCRCIKCDLNNVAYFLNKSNEDFSDFVKNENETLLHIACRLHHLTLVKILVATGLANPESTDEFGNTPLHTACSMDHPLIIKYLVSIKGINLNALNHLQENILHISCKSGSLDTVQSIVQNGNVDFFQVNKSGYTPFHAACESNRTNILDYLCKIKGGCINVVSSQSLESPLHVAVRNSCTNVVKYLVETCKINVNLQDSKGQTALHLACEHEVQDIAEIILLNKRTQKPVAQIKDTKGETPLIIACKNKHWKIICYLVSLKEVKLTDKLYDNSNELLLHYLCVHNQVEIIKQADLTSVELKRKDDFGNNPFHLACRSGCFETISYFCLFFELEEDHFVDTNFVGETPLSISCDIGDSNIIKSIVSTKALTAMVPIGHNKFLLHLLCESEATDEIKLLDFEHVINLNFVNRNGETALGVAIRQSNKDIIKILASQKGIDLTATDVMGNNLLHLACSSNEKDFIIGIEERIQKKLVKSQNKHDETPLMCACKHKHWTLIEYLISLGEVTLLDRIDDQQLLIHFLCLEGKVNFLKKFQLSSKCLTSKDNLDNTPLHLACKSGCIETVKHLLSDLSSIHLQSPTDMNVHSETPLSICCQKMLLKVLKLLVISYKITPITSISPTNDNFVLHFLSETESVDIIKLLDFENEANICAVDYKGETAIDIALKYCSEDMLKFLCSIKYSHGNNLLHIACIKSIEKLVMHIIEKNEELVNSQNDNGETPLTFACRNKHWMIISCLMSTGNINLTTEIDNAQLILHFLCSHGKIGILKNCKITNTDLKLRNVFGDTILHSACSSGSVETVRYILSIAKNVCLDLIMSNNKKVETPLSKTYSNKNWKIMEALLSVGKVDPMALVANGNHLLHVLCENKKNSLINLLDLESIVNVNINNGQGENVLHIACRVGNLEMIKLLLSTDKLDLMASDEPAKNTPLHIACKWGRVEIVDFLLSTGKVDTKKANACLKTPLHLACANYNKEVVKVFITYGQIDLTVKDNYGRTAFDVAKYSYQLVTLFYPFIESQQKFPVEKYCKVFLCGDTTNGKSTLALSIKKRLSGSSFSWIDKVNPFKTQPKAVPLTAGIVPFQLESEEIGNIVLYDFAGHPEYYSSHHAVLENLLLRSPAVFIILIKLTDKREEITKQLYYWTSYIQYASRRSSRTCPVILVGSYADKSSQIHHDFEHLILDILPDIKIENIIALDCRSHTGSGFDSLIQSLQKATTSVLGQCESISFSCHVLYAYLKKISVAGAIKLKQLKKKIQEENAKDSYSSLPNNDAVLLESLITLSDKGLILVSNTKSDNDTTWIIVELNNILHTINGTLFAPKSFKEYNTNLASNTGLITISKLKDTFPQYDILMIIEFMKTFEFCHEIDETTARCISNETNLSEGVLFFPALIGRDLHPEEAVISNGFGWCLWCNQSYHFFSTRLLQILMLRLTFTFSSTTIRPGCVSGSLEQNIKTLNRSCHVWKNGVCWTKDGVKIAFQIGEHSRSIVLLVQPVIEAASSSCILMYASIIHKILKAVNEFCPYCETAEYFISPTDLNNALTSNLANLSVFDASKVVRSILLKNQTITNTRNETLDISVLLGKHEPYHSLPLSVITQLLINTKSNEVVPDNIIQQLNTNCPTVMESFPETCCSYLSLTNHLCKYTPFIERSMMVCFNDVISIINLCNFLTTVGCC